MAASSEQYQYMNGWGNHFESEALPGTLPENQNSPQKCAHGLYAEQLSGTAFTAPRVQNQRSWLYRIRPSVCQRKFTSADQGLLNNDWSSCPPNPNHFRWSPIEMPAEGEEVTFVQGMKTMCGAGDPSAKSGVVVYIYTANKSMVDEAFYNADGDYLIVPQQGTLDITTEFGKMTVASGEICVIPRGIVFAVAVAGPSRGYIAEVFDGHFRIPDLGPIGANGLANPRDFQTPVAWFERRECTYTVFTKYLNKMFKFEKDHSPFNVVGWHGNYAPYKYNLAHFNTFNSVTYDHADPSIFTVLTVQTNTPGTAALDFVIFPWRWTVAEHTFRPPYYHRNCMSEFMGLIRGEYEAKAGGFMPGGASLHSCMTSHGPDTESFNVHSEMELKPMKIPDTTLAFMFESTYMFHVTPFAQERVQEDYIECWQGLKDLGGVQ